MSHLIFLSYLARWRSRHEKIKRDDIFSVYDYTPRMLVIYAYIPRHSFLSCVKGQKQIIEARVQHFAIVLTAVLRTLKTARDSRDLRSGANNKITIS